MSGSKRPTSIMMPKKVIAKNSSAAVGATPSMDFVMSSASPSPPPARRPKTMGTRMRAATGTTRLLMIRYRNVAIIANPRMTSMVISSLCSRNIACIQR